MLENTCYRLQYKTCYWVWLIKISIINSFHTKISIISSFHTKIEILRISFEIVS
jgi:hypothetical protein